MPIFTLQKGPFAPPHPPVRYAEGQGRSDIAKQLRRAHQMLIEQEAIQHEHRRAVGDIRV